MGQPDHRPSIRPACALIEVMTPDSSEPLDEEIDRGERGDQGVEVEIERLFDDRGCDQHRSTWPSRVPNCAACGVVARAEAGHDTLAVIFLVGFEESGVEDVDH